MNIDSSKGFDSSNTHILRCKTFVFIHLAQDGSLRKTENSKSKFEFEQDFDQIDSQSNSKLSRIFENSVKSAK